jgi:Aminotransferase class-V
MTVPTPIYLDFNASTPVAPEVADAMRRPLLDAIYGNPSSAHWAGHPAHAALEEARGQVAALLGCASDEIVFTSGGSEANNLAIKGAFFAARGGANHIVTTQIEHPATVQACRFLERFGAEVTYLRVDETGRVDPDDCRRAITARTLLVSIMLRITKSERSSRSRRSRASLASAACSFTRMPHRRLERSPSRWMTLASTCCRWSVISCTRRKESARCISGEESFSSR